MKLIYPDERYLFIRSPDLKWKVVVGKPNLVNWGEGLPRPDLSKVGLPITWKFFLTRREARMWIRDYFSKRNPYWHYKVEKI